MASDAARHAPQGHHPEAHGEGHHELFHLKKLATCSFLLLVAMASNLLAMASNLLASEPTRSRTVGSAECHSSTSRLATKETIGLEERTKSTGD